MQADRSRRIQHTCFPSSCNADEPHDGGVASELCDVVKGALANGSSSADVIAALKAEDCTPSSAALAFVHACYKGYIDVIDMFLDSAAEFDLQAGLQDNVSLKVACEGGHIDVVKRLLDLPESHGVSTQSQYDSAFAAACRGGNIEIVQLLLEQTGQHAVDTHSHEEAGFKRACAKGHEELVALLLRLEGDRRVDAAAGVQEGLCLAVNAGHERVVRLLMGLEGDWRMALPTPRRRGPVFTTARGDALWHGTLLRQARKAPVLLRASQQA